MTWQFEEIGTHEFGCASWLWFVPACVAVAVGCGWRAPISRRQLNVFGAHVSDMAIGGDWYPRVWLRQLVVFCSRVCGCGSLV